MHPICQFITINSDLELKVMHANRWEKSARYNSLEEARRALERTVAVALAAVCECYVRTCFACRESVPIRKSWLRPCAGPHRTCWSPFLDPRPQHDFEGPGRTMLAVQLQIGFR